MKSSLHKRDAMVKINQYLVDHQVMEAFLAEVGPASTQAKISGNEKSGPGPRAKKMPQLLSFKPSGGLDPAPATSAHHVPQAQGLVRLITNPNTGYPRPEHIMCPPAAVS